MSRSQPSLRRLLNVPARASTSFFLAQRKPGGNAVRLLKLNWRARFIKDALIAGGHGTTAKQAEIGAALGVEVSSR
jgi:hypothetical protein